MEHVQRILAAEMQTLDALLYRNKSQHGRAKYFKQLQQVRRQIKELDVKQLTLLCNQLKQDLVKRPAKRGHESAKALSVRHRALGKAIDQCCEIIDRCIRCSHLLAHEVAQHYFLNLMVIFIAILGRLAIIARRIGLLGMDLYKAIQSDLPPALQEEVARVEALERTTKTSFALLAEDEKQEEELMEQHAQQQIETGDETAVGGAHDDVGISLQLSSFSTYTERVEGKGKKAGAEEEKKGKEQRQEIKATTFSRSLVAKGGQNKSGRALLATEYSSSEDEEEIVGGESLLEEAAEAVAAAEEEEDVLEFVIDRGPSTAKESDAAITSPQQAEVKKKQAGESACEGPLPEAVDSTDKKVKRKKKRRVESTDPAAAATAAAVAAIGIPSLWGPSSSFSQQQLTKLLPTASAKPLAAASLIKEKTLRNKKRRNKTEKSKGSLLDDIDSIFSHAHKKKKAKE